MKRLILLLVLLPGCLGPQSTELTDAQNAVIDTLQAITADNVVTPEEQASLDAAMARYFAAKDAAGPSFSWDTFLASVATSLGPGGVAIYALINASRNKSRAAALAKLSTPSTPVPS